MNTTQTEETREDKVRRFQLGLNKLYDATSSHLIKVLINKKHRQVQDVVNALVGFMSPLFSRQDMEQMSKMLVVARASSNAQIEVPSHITNRLTDAKTAEDLLFLYAEILEVPSRTIGGKHFPDWTKAPEIDTITV